MTEWRRVGSLERLQRYVYNTAVNKGWWDKGKERTFPELIALCHSELSEALEEYRNGVEMDKIYYAPLKYTSDEMRKPEGIPIELADVVIRILDLCGYYNINLEDAINQKMAYNESRPYRHGGKRL